MPLLHSFWLRLLLVTGAVFPIQAQDANPKHILVDSNITAEGFLRNSMTVDEFISEDNILSFLSEGHNILDPGVNPELKSRLHILNNQLRESKQSFEHATFEKLEEELFKLNDGFEAIYQRLLRFSRVLVSLTVDDMVGMADILVENKDYYDQIMNPESLKVPNILGKRLLGQFDDKVDASFKDSSGGSSRQQQVPEDTDMEIEFKKYWDPDLDYELLQDFMLEDIRNPTPTEKLNDLVQTSGILKKIKHNIDGTKYKVATLIKLIKMKKLLKSKKSVACLALIKTIEKIKRCLKHIKHCIIIKVKMFLKNLPQNAIYKLKILVRLIIKILLQILWELQYLISELSYKLYFFLKKLKKIPIVIILYMQELCKKEEWEDDWDDWDDWTEWRYDNDEDDWNDDEDDFVSYAFTPTLRTPTEIDEIFENVFSKAEQKQIDKESFNFDFEFDFNDDIDKHLDLIDLEKQQTSSF